MATAEQEKQALAQQVKDRALDFLGEKKSLRSGGMIKVGERIVILTTRLLHDNSVERLDLTSFVIPEKFDAVLESEAHVAISNPGSKIEAILGLENLPENWLAVLNVALGRHLAHLREGKDTLIE